VRQQSLAFGQILVGAQHGAGKTATLHLAELVHQHIACRANIALKTAALAQHQRLAEGAPVGELREMQFYGLHAREVLQQGVGVVGQLYIGSPQSVSV